VLALPCLLYAMDLTVLNLALPQISADLQPSSTQLLWIVDIYGFLAAGSLVTMGTLGDRIGRRRLLLAGAAAFGVVSVVAAFSVSPEMLIASRALLGIAGATLAPSTLSLIRSMFADPGQRTVAVGVWISSFSAGAAIGPVLGGLLLEWFWSGSVFLVAVPVMVVLLLLGPVLLPEFRDPAAGRLDLRSAALSVAAVLAVIYGLKELAQDGPGWGPAVSIVAGLVLGAVFLRRQRTAMVPSAVGLIVGSMLAPILVRWARPWSVMAGGLVLGAFGFGLLTQVDGDSGLALVVAGSVVFSVGLAPLTTLSTDLMIGAAPPERAGAASRWRRPPRSSAGPWASPSSAASARPPTAASWPRPCRPGSRRRPPRPPVTPLAAPWPPPRPSPPSSGPPSRTRPARPSPRGCTWCSPSTPAWPSASPCWSPSSSGASARARAPTGRPRRRRPGARRSGPAGRRRRGCGR
jgi:DHA2 family multidrug resistance protein-like MFS transporter